MSGGHDENRCVSLAMVPERIGSSFTVGKRRDATLKEKTHGSRSVFRKPGAVVLILCYLVTECSTVQAFDYCAASKDLCQPPEARHVVCNGRRFAAACGQDPKLVKMKSDHREQILEFHNRLRNNLACGYFNRYAEASSMEELQWDGKLARMAEYNARTCHFAHDECRNTRKYRKVGQNLAINWFHGLNMTAAQAIEKFQRHWYLEYSSGRQKLLDRYGEQSMQAGIGHFTQMVHADTQRIGCALVRFQSVRQDLPVTQYYLVCNYSEGNLYERPVYRKGRRCSKCKYGCASEATTTPYRCLCHQPKG